MLNLDVFWKKSKHFNPNNFTCGQCDKGTPKGYPKSTHAQYGWIKLNVTSATKCDQCDKGTSKSYPESTQSIHGGIKLNVNSASKN